MTNTYNHRIQKFTLDGLTKWGTWGNDDGQFRSPSGVAVDNSGNVYVADTDNRRIQKFMLVPPIKVILPVPERFHNYPNPFNPFFGTRFVFYLNQQAHSVVIRVYNLRGRLIRKLKGTTQIGCNEVFWDGKDEEGDAVPSAVFLCHIEISPEGERIQPNPLKIVAWR